MTRKPIDAADYAIHTMFRHVMRLAKLSLPDEKIEPFRKELMDIRSFVMRKAFSIASEETKRENQSWYSQTD